MTRELKKITKAWLFVCFVLFSFASSYSQTHLTYTLTNFTSTANTLSYDLYITNDGTTQVKLANLVVGINYNPAILNGSTNTVGNNTNYTYEAGSRSAAFDNGTVALNAYNNVFHQYALSPAKNHLRFQTSAPASITASVPLTAGVPYKLGHFVFANAGGVNWASSSNAGLTFQGTAVGGYANTQASVYVNSDTGTTTYTGGANLAFSYVNSPYFLNTCTNTSSRQTISTCDSSTLASTSTTYTPRGK